MFTLAPPAFNTAQITSLMLLTIWDYSYLRDRLMK